MITDFGSVLKKLRNEKNLSQSKIANKNLSRSMVAKIESNETIPNILKFRTLLQQLDVSFEELFYISENYSLSKVDQFRNDFFSVVSNANTEEYLKLLKRCDILLEKEQDLAVLELRDIILAMLELYKDNFEKAKELVLPVWNRLSKFKNWCLSDIKLINCIFFILPVDEAEKVVNAALIYLKKYEDLSNNKKLEMNLKINLAHLMMINKKIGQRTVKLLEEVISEAKVQKNYFYHIVATFRLGICEKILGKEEGSNKITQTFFLCNMLEDTKIREILHKENDLYFSD